MTIGCRRLAPLLSLAAFAGFAAGAPAPAAAPVFRPGTIARWAGDGLEACAIGDRRFAPLAGACLYPIDLLHVSGPLLLVRWRAGRRETTRIRVGRFDYPVQRLTLPRAMVELSPADAARVRRENAEVAPLFRREGERRFTLPLGAPLEDLPRGGRFGSRRIINGLLRSPHGGMDYGAPEGRPVVTADDGTVALVAEHFFSGRSVFVDHGDGLVSMYFHLSRILVSPGQELRRGEVLGEVGSTGRSTAPHLHFGVRWRGARVNPDLLLADPDRIAAVR